MGFEPPPNIMRADRMRKEGIGRGIKTGAKTATKDQEREFLERFRLLYDDPDVALPAWKGSGPDALARLRSRMHRVHRRRDSPGWLKWYGRGRRLHHAYAQTLLALRAGKIQSFASLPFQGRDVKFVLRGRGLREKLAGLHNFQDPAARLLAHIDSVKSHRVVVVSHSGGFSAYHPGDPLPPSDVAGVLTENGVDVEVVGDGCACAHAQDAAESLAFDFGPCPAKVHLCRACLKKLPRPLSTVMDAGILTPQGQVKADRRPGGSAFHVHPGSAAKEYQSLLETAGRNAQDRASRFEGVSDLDILDWTQEEFGKLLDARTGGFLIVGRDLWLNDFQVAAQRYGSTPLEQAALRTAFAKQVPRLRAGDATLSRLLDPAWTEHAPAILGQAASNVLDDATLRDLTRQRPGEALSTLARLLENEAKVAQYPQFGPLPPPLRLTHDLFKANRAGDAFRFQRRLSEGIHDPALKPLSLALARAFGQGAGIEWQYAPHEKDQALFFEPAARLVAGATPTDYSDALGAVARAANLPPPAPLAR